MESMTFQAMKNCIEVGHTDEVLIFRDPASGQYEILVSFLRSDPRPHSQKYRLITQRGDVRRFRTIDSAFNTLNRLGLIEAKVCFDPCQEERYRSGAIDSQQSLAGL